MAEVPETSAFFMLWSNLVIYGKIEIYNDWCVEMMKTMSTLVACIFTLLTMTGPAHARKYYKPMPLHEALTAELNGVLRAANEMHSAFFEQNEKKIEASVEQVLNSIARAEKKTALAESQKPHLLKMLEATREEMNEVKNSSGNDRKQSLKNALEQLVLIAQTYQLEKYKIFFCPKDRAVWLQKSWKAKNPIHPKLHAQCGKLVR